MAFQTPITIKDVIDRIHTKQYLLPAIQREFVWDTEQIERLFDSVMRGYPINSFLFWSIENENISNYEFYEFLRDYHERDHKNNPKADLSGERKNITAILDGQQRLTSLYIGLRGTFAFKDSKKRVTNDLAYPQRKLCLNLFGSPKNEELEYEFSFLNEKQRSIEDENHLWIVVGDILNIKSYEGVYPYVSELKYFENYKGADFKRDYDVGMKKVSKLFQAIHVNQTINYYEEKNESLDKVLDIFVRVNSGGTPLSRSDLLLSVATATWEEKDAREEVTSLVKEINNIGDGFSFDKDFVLKSSLTLLDMDMALKVNNFNHATMQTIEKNWDDIKKSILLTVQLVSKFGYDQQKLTSTNALIPIAYYLYKIRNPDNFDASGKFEEDRRSIFKWLGIVLLKRLFSGQPDNVLRPMREVISKSFSQFPLDEIIQKQRGDTKTLLFDQDEINNITKYEYGKPYTYSALAFLYPTFDHRNRFHLDHIFPKKLFTVKELKKHGISDDLIQEYLDNFNSLVNIQLLEGVVNQEKSGKDFNDWLLEKYPNNEERINFLKRHLIPSEIDLRLNNFLEFVKLRKQLIMDELSKLLK